MSSPPVSGRTRPNERRIRAWLARVGEASRTDLARQLELPKATVAGLVTDLIERGVVAEVPRGQRPAGAPGRPAQVLTLTGLPPAIAALTWSTGMLRVAIATLRGQVLAENAAAAESGLAQSAVAELAADALETASCAAGYDAAPLAAVVLSVPARSSMARALRSSMARALRSSMARARRSRGQRPASAGDADPRGSTRAWPANWPGGPGVRPWSRTMPTWARSASTPSARGAESRTRFTSSSAATASVPACIFGGRLHRGTTGFAGELAHVQVRDDGPMCTCGGRGCLIQMVSTEMIGLAQPAYEQPLTFATMLSLAEAGDIGLQRLLVDLGRSIGLPLADACTLLNPDLFVLDGSIGPAGDHIFNGITEAIGRYATPATSAAARVVRGVLGTNAEVLGAVVLVRQAWERAEGMFSGAAAPR